MVRQISWIAVIPQIIALSISIALASHLFGRQGIVIGGCSYLAYSIGSRILIPRYHRRGIRLLKQQRFADAIPLFRQSLKFFNAHSWIDRYRSIVLMSPSAVCYREMALANIGFCYSQIGDGVQARKNFKTCLELFPDNGLATTAVRMIDSASVRGDT